MNARGIIEAESPKRVMRAVRNQPITLTMGHPAFDLNISVPDAIYLDGATHFADGSSNKTVTWAEYKQEMYLKFNMPDHHSLLDLEHDLRAGRGGGVTFGVTVDSARGNRASRVNTGNWRNYESLWFLAKLGISEAETPRQALSKIGLRGPTVWSAVPVGVCARWMNYVWRKLESGFGQQVEGHDIDDGFVPSPEYIDPNALVYPTHWPVAKAQNHLPVEEAETPKSAWKKAVRPKIKRTDPRAYMALFSEPIEVYVFNRRYRTNRLGPYPSAYEANRKVRLFTRGTTVTGRVIVVPKNTPDWFEGKQPE